MAIKLDMGKSYDWVECSFIESVMQKMGFPRKMDSTNHAMHIYNILLCDYQWSSPQVYLPYKRSPSGRPLISLFLLCADGFSSLIKDAARNQLLSGISICRGCPMVTRLFFTNGSLLFCKATDQECWKLIYILELYEAAFGQKVNVDKSYVFFNHNTPYERRCEVLNILGPMQGTCIANIWGFLLSLEDLKLKCLLKWKKRLGGN